MGEVIRFPRELREPKPTPTALRCRCPIGTDRKFIPQSGCPVHGSTSPGSGSLTVRRSSSFTPDIPA